MKKSITPRSLRVLKLVFAKQLAFLLFLSVQFSAYGQIPITVTGPTSTCNDSGTYSIPNPGSNIPITWTVTGRNNIPTSTAISSSNGGNIFTLNYNATQAFQITVSYQIGSQTFSGSITTYSCCDYSNYLVFDNTTASAVIAANGNPIINKNILIRGVFNVNTLIKFIGCNIEMSEGSEIKLSDYGSWENCVLKKACLGYRWRGITVLNGGTIKLDLGTTISDAQFAINFQGTNTVPGAHNLRNSTLINNIVGIRTQPFVNHYDVWAGIDGMIFDGSGVPALPYFQMANQNAIPSAIVLNDMQNFPMITTDPNNPNTIRNYQGPAVNINRSNAYLDGIVFQNIANLALSADRQFVVPPQFTNYSFTVINSSFINARDGISIRNATGSLNAPISIVNNVFSFSGNVPLNTAIRYIPNTTANAFYNISSNNIFNPRFGIVLNGLNTTDDNGIVSLNTINMERNLATGIRIVNCSGAKVFSNNLWRLNQTAPTAAATNIGIDANIATSMSVDRNTFTNLGAGVRYTAVNLLTQNKCNRFDADQRGFALVNATLSNQGASNNPQNNTFDNFGGNLRVFGSALPASDWYHKSGAINLLTPRTFNVLIAHQVNSSWGCPIANPQRPMSYFDTLNVPIDTVIAEVYEATESVSEEVMRDLINAQLAELIEANQVVVANDSTLLNFYNDYITTNTKIIQEIEKLIAERNYSDAQTLIDNFNPARDYEQDWVVALNYSKRIYTDSSYVLSSQDTAILLAIANKSVFQSGKAVLIARAILELDIQDAAPNAFRMAIDADKNADGDFTFNKSNRNYTFYLDNESVLMNIEVFDVSGKMLNRYYGNTLNLQSQPDNLIIKVSYENKTKVFRNL